MHVPKALDPVAALQEALPDAIKNVKTFRGETTIEVAPGRIVEAARFMRDTSGLVYNYLSDISAVDYWDQTGNYDSERRFAVCYHIYSMLYNRRLRLKVYLPEEDPTVATLTVLWANANWLEREIIDLMGITFTGHPDPRRVLMPDDWDGHPHRRDYPLGYETIMFSFNADEIAKHKPFAKE